MKLKTDMIGFGNSKMLNLGYKLLPSGLIVATLGGLLIELGGAWYQARTEQSNDFVETLFEDVQNDNK